MNSETVKSLTPLLLAAIGTVGGTIVVLAVVFSPNLSENKSNSIMVFATTVVSVLAGAAGGATIPQSKKATIDTVQNVENFESKE